MENFLNIFVLMTGPGQMQINLFRGASQDDKDFVRLHQNQPQLGWNDCFLQVYFFLAGAKYNVNPRLHNIWPENPNLDLNEMKKHYDMVHNYKNFYEGR
jgi:hypothetical protein